ATVTTDDDGNFEYVPEGLAAYLQSHSLNSVTVNYWAIALERTPLMLPSDAPIASGGTTAEEAFPLTFVKNVAPVITALELQNNTGATNDNRTSDATIVGTIEDVHHSADSIRVEFFLDNDTPNGILNGDEEIQGVAIPAETGTPGTLSFKYLPV